MAGLAHWYWSAIFSGLFPRIWHRPPRRIAGQFHHLAGSQVRGNTASIHKDLRATKRRQRGFSICPATLHNRPNHSMVPQALPFDHHLTAVTLRTERSSRSWLREKDRRSSFSSTHIRNRQPFNTTDRGDP
jgi:hypothetical protein